MHPFARLCGLVAALFSLSSTAATLPAGEVEQQAVLVTGASSGIGRKITEVLAQRGYFVYAGARKQADLDALNKLDNVRSVRLDVTIQEQVDAAVDTVEADGRGLHGLVNNAGVFIGGPLADVDVEEFKWLMDVNVNGVYRVTQAFAPLIIASRGRIANIGSIAGILSGRFSGQYSMSKHAIEAYTDSLAAEMSPLGVHVSVIEPGNYASRISDSGKRRVLDRYDDYVAADSPFAEEFKRWIDADWDRSIYKAPDEVAEAVVHALAADEPLRRYMVVPAEREARWTIGKQIEELVQLNEWHAWTYSRADLIGMLDAVPDSEDDVETLAESLQHFLANTSDAGVHEEFWADDLVYTSSDGTRFGKAEIMEGLRDAGESNDADVAYSGDDVKVQVFGATAIVTFRLVGTQADGAAPQTYFNTGTFLKRDGRWQAVAWQATAIPAT